MRVFPRRDASGRQLANLRASAAGSGGLGAYGVKGLGASQGTKGLCACVVSWDLEISGFRVWGFVGASQVAKQREPEHQSACSARLLSPKPNPEHQTLNSSLNPKLSTPKPWTHKPNMNPEAKHPVAAFGDGSRGANWSGEGRRPFE